MAIRLFELNVHFTVFVLSLCAHASHKLNKWPVIKQREKGKRNQTWTAHQWNMFRCWSFLFAAISHSVWKKIKIAKVSMRFFFLLVTAIWLKWKRVTKWLTMVIRAPHAIIQLPCARIRKTRNYNNWHFSVNTFYWHSRSLICIEQNVMKWP